MTEIQKAFQIMPSDNVATALAPLAPGEVTLIGDSPLRSLEAVVSIPAGHKIALSDIDEDQPVIKYGVVIGKATKQIRKGTWVHLHCMKSVYDERSSHLDVMTGAPLDIRYE